MKIKKLAPKKTILIGISGGSGSGKTSIAKKIYKKLKKQSVIIISQDSFYKDQSHLSFQKRKKINYDHPDAFDSSLLYKDLIKLKQGRQVDIPIYNYGDYTRSKKTIEIGPARVVIVEGVLLFVYKKVRDLMDIKIYVSTDDDIRFIRRLKRDLKERKRTLNSITEQYLKTVRPMHHQFVEPTKRYADIIIPEGGSNTIGINILINQIRMMSNQTFI